MEKPKLFEEWKHFVLTLAALLFLLLLRLGFEYHAYQQFISLPFFFTDAKVLAAYDKQKENRRYRVLKLKSKEGHTFFTTTHQKGNLADKRLRLQLFPDEHISFWDYLGTFYVKSRIKQTEQKSLTFKERLYEKVVQQHLDPSLQSFYNAIFFATPLPKEMRQKISLLGISHLVALSGFHLGILWGLVYGMLLLLYRPLQQRYFPYRFALLDVGGVSILILGFYVWFVGTPPSLLRAYAMVLIGWSILLMGIELLSFTAAALYKKSSKVADQPCHNTLGDLSVDASCSPYGFSCNKSLSAAFSTALIAFYSFLSGQYITSCSWYGGSVR